MVRVPLRVPSACGVNVTEIWQLALAARAGPHVLVNAKSLGFVPARLMLEMSKVANPVLVRVTVWGASEIPIG
jgi:hypothetical protein